MNQSFCKVSISIEMMPFHLSIVCISRLSAFCSIYSELSFSVKGEHQRENKLISYERAFKMLENGMYITGIGQAVLELLSFEVRSHQWGISLLQKFLTIFDNMMLVSLKMTSVTSENSQYPKHLELSYFLSHVRYYNKLWSKRR